MSIEFFFFGITLCCFTGRGFGLDKAKIQLYSVIVGLFYGMKVDYASLLGADFVSSVKKSKKTTEISGACFSRFILHEAYS